MLVTLVVLTAGSSPSPASAAVTGDACGTSGSPTGYSVTTCVSVLAGPLTGYAAVSGAVETSVGTARVASLVFSLDGSYLITDYDPP